MKNWFGKSLEKLSFFLPGVKILFVFCSKALFFISFEYSSVLSHLFSIADSNLCFLEKLIEFLVIAFLPDRSSLTNFKLGRKVDVTFQVGPNFTYLGNMQFCISVVRTSVTLKQKN